MSETRIFRYEPPPTLEAFHLDPSFERYVIGPYGSAKTTAGIMELVRVAATQSPAADGIRYTRMAIIRNTLESIKQTTLPDVQQLLDPIVHYKVADKKIEIRTEEIHSDWLLVPLEDPDDVRRLLSMQLTMAFMEEFREIDHGLLVPLIGRLGRYPSNVRGSASRDGLIGTSNPMAEGTPWYKYLVTEKPKTVAFYRQPSGLGRLAENVANLPPGYYQRLAEGRPADWVKVHVHGEFGDDLSGRQVFRASFAYSRHVTTGLEVQPSQVVAVGLDIGRTPTAIFGQLDVFGRLLVLDEITVEDMGLEQFCREHLRPRCSGDRYVARQFAIVFDPAGTAKSQVNELSPQDVLRAAGFNAIPAPTNDLEPRLRAVETLLLQNRGEHPAIQIDERHCPKLVQALRFDYKYKRKKDGSHEDLPDKTHPWSDLADALQYLCLGVNLNLPGKVMRRLERRRQPARSPPSALAWT